MISECACCAICRTSVARYASGIQSLGSIRWSAATTASNRPAKASPASATVTATHLPTDRSVGTSVQPTHLP
ncbi:hypothetical protein GCM10020229_02560 [Kitasatospora albolonga]